MQPLNAAPDLVRTSTSEVMEAAGALGDHGWGTMGLCILCHPADLVGVPLQHV
jgi:hypothetical protein